MPKIFQIEPEIVSVSIDPYWTTSDGETIKLYHGHVTNVLARLPAKSVHMCVTSPPYWGLRNYKAGDEEIGREETPEEFVATMVGAFQEVRRVLRDDGTVWLNLGDSYDGNGLVGIPWRVALALQADGWVLRQDIIWHKPAPMPESVKNRCTKAHEYVFLLAKSERYYYDAPAIAEKATLRGITETGDLSYSDGASRNDNAPSSALRIDRETRNRRSVWTVNTSPYIGAHFATFPPDLVEPMIKAGTSEKGCCALCGAPWKRVVEKKTVHVRPPEKGLRAQSLELGQNGANSLWEGYRTLETKTVGWEPTCECDSEVVPCVVLDPFMGSGTTACVSVSLGRHAVGIELNEKYIKNNQIPRIEGELLSRPETAKLIRRERKPLTGFKIIQPIRLNTKVDNR